MGQTIAEITAGIERRIKPTLTGRDQHLGFCTALEHVNKELGRETVVGDGEIVARAVEGRICPDCGAVMVKRRATTEAGEIRVAWICDCDPERELTPEPAAESVDAAAERARRATAL